MSKSNEYLIESYNRGYRVSKCGNELTTSRRILQQSNFDKQGYPRFSLKINNKTYSLYWHRLQAYQKYKEQLFEEKIVVRHQNDIKIDCSYDNIIIGTQTDNMLDISKEKRQLRAQNAANHLIKYDYKEIQDFHIINRSYKETMNHFNISSKGTLNHILNH